MPDDHFAAEARDEDIRIHPDPTPRLEQNNEHVLVTALRDMTDADTEIVETLAGSGGNLPYEELADRSDRSISTIYRCRQRLHDILEADAGEISFRNQKIAEDLRAVVERAESTLESAADQLSRIYDLEIASETTDAFERWLTKWGAELETDEQGNIERLRIDTVVADIKSLGAPFLGEVLEDAMDAWYHDRQQLKDAKVIWPGPDGQEHRGFVSSYLE